MGWIEGIHGMLIDIDGTLLDGAEAIPGAREALARLEAAGIAVRITTNTTRRPRSAVAAALASAGIPVDPERILSPSTLAQRWILASGRTRTAFLLPDETKADFVGVEENEETPDWVVVGDAGDGFTFDRMNRAFHWLRHGAGLLALQKNRFWHAGARGLLLDAGPFVVALEYASGTHAEVLGKPAPAFFQLALTEIDLEASRVLVVGDDIEADGAGGAAAGCRTALVRTGKYTHESRERSSFWPDLVIDSIADLRPT
jgi:HAD superfamily hydrolase (TIGR01458 family)